MNICNQQQQMAAQPCSACPDLHKKLEQSEQSNDELKAVNAKMRDKIASLEEQVASIKDQLI